LVHNQLTIESLLAISTFAGSGGGIIYTDEHIDGATLNIEVRQPVDHKKAQEVIEWVRSTALTVS